MDPIPNIENRNPKTSKEVNSWRFQGAILGFAIAQSLLNAALLGVGAIILVALQQPSADILALRARVEAPKQWEYKVITLESNTARTGADALKATGVTPSEDTLDTLGQEGWELVSSYLELETAYPNFGNEKYVTGLQPNVRPQRVVLLLKKQKS